MSAAVGLDSPSRADAELIRAVETGDLESLGLLFDRYSNALRRYLERLGFPASDADDLIQATFLEVMRAAPRFDPSYPARAWLFGIATSMARRQRRTLARTAARLASWAGLAPGTRAPTPAEIFESDEATRLFERALASLSAKKREVFVLVTLEGLSGEEAARALGVPVNTIWTRLHHARRELRAALEEDDR